MVNQKTSCHKRLADSSSIKSILRKGSESQVPKGRQRKRVSFAAHGEEHSRFEPSWTRSHPGSSGASKHEPPRNHLNGICFKIHNLMLNIFQDQK